MGRHFLTAYTSLFAAVEEMWSQKIPRVLETAVGEERVLTRLKPTMKRNVGILNVTELNIFRLRT